jgi:hypothetical protein
MHFRMVTVIAVACDPRRTILLPLRTWALEYLLGAASNLAAIRLRIGP